MQIRRTYEEINPELLYAEIRDFALKQGVLLKEAKLETYTLPDESATFVSRGTLVFRPASDENGPESLRAHLVGSTRAETKLMIDVDEARFSQDRVDALISDVDFIFGNYETPEK